MTDRQTTIDIFLQKKKVSLAHHVKQIVVLITNNKIQAKI
jgi:hypothetical protein